MPEERKPKLSLDEIEAIALKLPVEERRELIERLRAQQSGRAIRERWIDEAERRMELSREGNMRLLDADEVLADPDYDDETDLLCDQAAPAPGGSTPVSAQRRQIDP